MAWSRFLVTGGGGFVGSCLVRRILDLDAEVTLLLKQETDLWRLKDVLPRVRVVTGDVTDADAVRRAVVEARPDAVFHLAAHGGSESQQEGERILRANILGTLTLLSACVPSSSRLFVHAGSSSEYGFKTEPMRETDPLDPNSIYAVGKAAATHLCRLFSARSSMAIVTLRLFSAYGPWEHPTRLVPTTLTRCLRHQPLEMVSKRTARDFIFIEDVLNAFLQFDRLAGITGEVINLATGVQSTMEDFVRVAVEVTGSRSEIRWEAMPARRWDTSTWVGSAEKAQRLLSWRAAVDLREGLRRTLEWMKVREGRAP